MIRAVGFVEQEVRLATYLLSTCLLQFDWNEQVVFNSSPGVLCKSSGASSSMSADLGIKQQYADIAVKCHAREQETNLQRVRFRLEVARNNQERPW